MPDHRDGPNQFFEQAKDRFHDWGWFIPPICRDFLDGLYLYIFLDMYIYILLYYIVYTYTYTYVYMYTIYFFRYLLVSLRVSEQKYGNTSLE